MNASARTARRILRDRRRTQRAAARINRNGTGTIASHCIAAGATHQQATAIAQTLRKQAVKAGITGTPARIHAGRHMRNATRYTPAQVATMASMYKARRAEYKLIGARLALAA